MQQGQTAILFLSRSLNDEYNAKGKGFSKRFFKSFYQFLITGTLNTLNQSDLPVFQSYSNQQIGNSFGERLTHELKRIQAQGFASVIIVGNDSPELKLDDISIAEEELLKRKSVLGKNQRGGTYLIAFRFDQTDLNQIEDVDWHTGRVAEQLNAILFSPTILKTKIDLNSQLDILNLLKSGLITGGVKAFFSLLLQPSFGSFKFKQKSRRYLLSNSFRRGPPFIA